MAVKGARSIPKIHFPSPKAPKLPQQAVIKGPGVPKMKAPGVSRIPKLAAPKVVLAKAAAGGRTVRGRRNPDYPTP